MKKTSDKILSLLLAVTILLAAFGGCGPGAEQSTQSGPSSESKTESSTESSQESSGAGGERKLRIAVGRGAEVIDYETNEYIKWLTEQTDIDIEWEQIISTTLIDKIPVMMMSGSLPDVFLNCDFTSTMQMKYAAEEKLLIPLNDLIEQYGTETKRLFEEQPGVQELITLSDGNIYALPTYSDIVHVNYAQRALINTTFLEALNMDMPETTEEFYAYLKAVKEGDPNGNGIADEIPLIGSIDGWHQDLFPWLTEPFIFDDGKYGKKVDVDENGKVFSILDKEEYREALRWIRKMYSEGLIYEGALTMKSDQYKVIGENPDALILGAAIGTGNKIISNLGGEVYNQFACIAPLEGPTGLRQTPWFRYANVRMGKFSITKDCQNPDLAFELADFMLSYDASMRLRMGVKDVDWVEAAEGETTIDNRPAVWKKLTPYTGEAQNQHLGNDGLFYETRGMFLDDSVYDHSKTLYSPENDQFLLANDAVKHYQPYGKEVFPPVNISTEDADEFASLEVQIKQCYEESRAAFVSGTMDLDKDWDSYVQTLKSYGLDRYVEILQKAYDESPVKIGS